MHVDVNVANITIMTTPDFNAMAIVDVSHQQQESLLKMGNLRECLS